MEICKEIIVPLAVAYNWPLVVLGIVFFWKPIQLLLKSLGELIERINTIKVGNTTYQLLGSPQKQSHETKKESSHENMQKEPLSVQNVSPQAAHSYSGYSNENLEHYRKYYQSLIVTEEEKIIAKQLSDAQLTKDQAIDLLIQNLAYANLNTVCWRINSTIFYEAKELLKHLNTKPVTIFDASEFLDGRIEYLLAYNLAVLQEDTLYISNMGREYLIFLTKIGIE